MAGTRATSRSTKASSSDIGNAHTTRPSTKGHNQDNSLSDDQDLNSHFSIPQPGTSQGEAVTSKGHGNALKSIRKRKKTYVDTASYVESSPQLDDFWDVSSRNIPMNEIQRLRTGTKKLWDGVKLPVENTIVRTAERKVKERQFDYDLLLANDGYLAVIDAAYKESMDANHPFTKDTEDRHLSRLTAWRQHGLSLLASVPEFLLKAFYSDQSITHRLKAGDKDLQRLFYTSQSDPEETSDWVQRYNDAFAPCVYARELVSKDGIPPTPNQLKQVIELLRGYVSGDATLHQQNAKIDSLSNLKSSEEDIAGGYHVFLAGKPHRVVILLTFCYALEKQLTALDPAEHKDPFLPMMYVGFAAGPKNRFREYTEERNQSWLTELFLMVCRYLFGITGFDLKQYVICFMTSHEECKIGEELFTRSGIAYAETGLGFGVAPAGVNLSSSDLKGMTAGVENKQWNEAMRFRNQAYFEDNMMKEARRLPRYEKKIEEIRATQKFSKGIRDRERKLEELKMQLKDAEKRAISGHEKFRQARRRLHTTQKAAEAAFKDESEVLKVLVETNALFQKQVKKEMGILSDVSADEDEDGEGVKDGDDGEDRDGGEDDE